MDAFDFLGLLKKLQVYYTIKPFIPRRLQVFLRRMVINRKRKHYMHVWPINPKSSTPPNGWSGWPDGKRFALVLTHDVEGIVGLNKVHDLVKLEQEYGVKSSFNFVPKRYNLPEELRRYLHDNGFEVGVHGLYHDGKLYKSKHKFKERATIINSYLREWGAVGFRAPSMHHQLAWNCLLNIEYDASTFDTDPFEPQSDGIDSIFPLFIDKCVLDKNGDFADEYLTGYVELPYTLPQDFSMFILLRENSVDIWKEKVDWIVQNGGMVLINTHPDYINFSNGKCHREEYTVKYYEEFLNYVIGKYKSQYWHALPKDVAKYVRGIYNASSASVTVD